VYAVVAKVSFLFTIPPGNVSPIFPSAGIALAAVMILGRKALAGVWLGSFLANTISFFDGTVSSTHAGLPELLVASFIGVGAMSGAGAGAFLVRRFCKDEYPLCSGWNVLVLVSVGAFGCCMVNSTFGLLSLALGGYIPWGRFGYSWITWWMGDATGAVVAAPLILAWHHPHPFRKNRWRTMEAALLGGMTLVLCLLVFFRNVPFAYGLMPLLLWAAFRFGMRGAATAAATVAIFGTIGTIHGDSLFARLSVNDSLLSLHSFLDVTIVCALFLGGVLAERKEAERALRQSEQKYRELVMLANSIILRWSRDGRITFLNEFGQRFFGYTEAEICGRHVVGTIVPASKSEGRSLPSLIDQICADPAAFEQSINENMRRNGERVWISWTNRAVLDERGQVNEILSIGVDITGRKRAEEELRATQASLEERILVRTTELAEARDRAEEADRIKSAFLAAMSHELRTPLNSIIGFTGIVLQGLAGPLNAEQTKQLGMVRGSARHLLELINDVLDLSKIEAGQLKVRVEPFDLPAAIERVTASLKPLAEKKGLTLNATVSTSLSQMVSDRRRLEQILLNLLNNAIKFTDHGRVALTAELVADYRPSPAAAPQPAVRLRVTDTGIGIKPADLASLFQPFRQIDAGLARQHEGTGLGLAICRRLVTLMGGEISAASQWLQGSEFTVTLPLTKLSDL
jgi:PAS domain S-box-containing protein